MHFGHFTYRLLDKTGRSMFYFEFVSLMEFPVCQETGGGEINTVWVMDFIFYTHVGKLKKIFFYPIQKPSEKANTEARMSLTFAPAGDLSGFLKIMFIIRHQENHSSDNFPYF